MTPEEQQAFEDRIYAYVGRQVCPPTPARDPVNAAMIRHWTEAMGDTNPAYTDPAWAAGSRRGRTIAPPAMLYVWNQEGMAAATRRPSDPQSDLIELFNAHGFTGVLGTNVMQEYYKEVSPGDQVFMEMVIDSISERKTTGRGTGYFYETLATFTDQDGDRIGTQRFRVLKFIPREQPAAAGEETRLQAPTRIASPRGHDNAWWWEACDEGRLLIQKCSDCGALRHPPRPMCGRCQSTRWESLEASGRGSVHSYTVLHHPPVPGYELPLPVALIDLEEGTRLVANLSCAPEEISIGMPVECHFEDVDEDMKLPFFRPTR